MQHLIVRGCQHDGSSSKRVKHHGPVYNDTGTDGSSSKRVKHHGPVYNDTGTDGSSSKRVKHHGPVYNDTGTDTVSASDYLEDMTWSNVMQCNFRCCEQRTTCGVQMLSYSREPLNTSNSVMWLPLMSWSVSLAVCCFICCFGVS